LSASEKSWSESKSKVKNNNFAGLRRGRIMSHPISVGGRRWSFILWPVCLYVFLAWAPPGESASVDLPPGVAITEGKTQQGFPYLSGGISTDEREVMEAWGKAYNVKLWFAERKGPYLSDVKLTVEGAKGVEILTVTTTGPWFYIQLPTGTYTVKATLAGVTREIKNLTVPRDKTVQRTLIWELAE
jgi:hypothetical protein